MSTESDNESDLYSDISESDRTDIKRLSDGSADFQEAVDMEVKAMSISEITMEMDALVQELSNFLVLPSSTCQQLLIKFSWIKESVLEKYYEQNDNSENFLKLCQIALPDSEDSATSSFGECCICTCEDDVSSLACNHAACDGCWQDYIIHKISKDNVAEIQCPGTDCKLTIGEDKILQHLIGATSKVLEAFNRLRVDSFIVLNKQMTWCPGKECGRVLKALKDVGDRIIPASCVCGRRFCFACTQEWHEPVNCRLMKLWLTKSGDDNMSLNYILAKTKACPKCQTPIEKISGCNVMNCATPACNAEFCWACLAITTNHGAGHGCNKFDDKLDLTPSDARTKARLALERYKHYNERYEIHQKSLALEQKLHAIVAEKMDTLQTTEPFLCLMEVQFLKKAVEVLTECRRTLMYTYAFAYFLEKDSNCQMFEENQANLERETEQLSRMLEREMDQSADFAEFKRNVQDKFRYVDHRRRVLLQHCREGKEMDFWHYTH